MLEVSVADSVGSGKDPEEAFRLSGSEGNDGYPFEQLCASMVSWQCTSMFPTSVRSDK
jgi:hypothetical protein